MARRTAEVVQVRGRMDGRRERSGVRLGLTDSRVTRVAASSSCGAAAIRRDARRPEIMDAADSRASSAVCSRRTARSCRSAAMRSRSSSTRSSRSRASAWARRSWARRMLSRSPCVAMEISVSGAAHSTIQRNSTASPSRTGTSETVISTATRVGQHARRLPPPVVERGPDQRDQDHDPGPGGRAHGQQQGQHRSGVGQRDQDRCPGRYPVAGQQHHDRHSQQHDQADDRRRGGRPAGRQDQAELGQGHRGPLQRKVPAAYGYVVSVALAGGPVQSGSARNRRQPATIRACSRAGREHRSRRPRTRCCRARPRPPSRHSRPRPASRCRT